MTIRRSVPSDGTIEIVTNTEGIDFDPDGYLWSVNSSQGQPIGHQETVFVPALEPGDYTVTLSGIAENCTLPAEANPQTTTVAPSDTVEVRFDVTCDLLSPPMAVVETLLVRGLQEQVPSISAAGARRSTLTAICRSGI